MRKVITIIVPLMITLTLLFSLGGSAFAAQPSDILAKGPRALEQFIFIHYFGDAYPDKPSKPSPGKPPHNSNTNTNGKYHPSGRRQ